MPEMPTFYAYPPASLNSQTNFVTCSALLTESFAPDRRRSESVDAVLLRVMQTAFLFCFGSR
jgi:hypothetical protein